MEYTSRASKNKIVDIVDNLPKENQQKLISWAIDLKAARKKRVIYRKRLNEIENEIAERDE